MKTFIFLLCTGAIVVSAFALMGCFPGKGAPSNTDVNQFVLNSFKPIPVSERKEKLSPMQY